MAVKERSQIKGTEAQIKAFAGHNGVLAYATDTKSLHVLSGTAGKTTEYLPKEKVATSQDVADKVTSEEFVTELSKKVDKTALATELTKYVTKEGAKDSIEYYFASKSKVVSPVYWAPYPISSNKTTVTIPNGTFVDINGTVYRTTSNVTIDARSLPGKDYYIYAVVETTGKLGFRTSNNATVPEGFTANNSRKIGGYHCLCLDVGTISGHYLSDYASGDILPNSVWDLIHRPKGDPEGYCYIPEVDIWMSIYLLSWNGTKLVSADYGVIANGVSSKKFSGELFSEQLHVQGLRLPWRHEFIIGALGSPEGVNISNSKAPNFTGSHSTTNGQRIISNYGLEDCTGVMWQWCEDLGFAGGSTWTDSVYNSDVDSIKRGKSYGTLFRLLVGASWASGASCGSRSVSCDGVSGDAFGAYGSRGVSEPLVPKANEVRKYLI
nr:MAG TPA: major tropism determinant [Caudoviricetes sp.]